MRSALIVGDLQNGIVENYPFAKAIALTVLRDGCADPDPEVHELLVERVFRGRGANVLSCAEWPGR